MPNLPKTIAMALIASALCAAVIAPAVYAADGAPLGAWRTTNECFLAILFLTAGGHAQAAYLSGEREEDASWMWDGSTLTITSPAFPLDRFTGHLANDRLEADYVWHDLQTDQLNSQNCVFERVEPIRLF